MGFGFVVSGRVFGQFVANSRASSGLYAALSKTVHWEWRSGTLRSTVDL
jgi:hypothetical protein